MTSKERVLTALNHQEPDRVPIDFGGTNTTGIHVTCVAALRDYYGLEKRPVLVHDVGQLLGWVDDDLKEALGVDVEGVLPIVTKFGLAAEDWKPWRLPNGLEVLVPGQFNPTVDENGDLLMHPEGDRSIPPSGRMPKDGYYFDAIIRQDPIDEEHLNPADNLEEFRPVSTAALEKLARSVQAAAAKDRAVTASLGGTSFGDIAQVPGVQLRHPKGIRDISEWYMSIAARPDYVRAVFERQCEIALANLERMAKVIGDRVDVVFICGTDFGTQTSAFCSVETFRGLYKPFYRQVNDWIHRHTNWKTFKHSCGAVEKFLEDFIDCGFDIFNPVQCSAANMDPRQLKAKYGERLVFWGGGVDTQKTLPFGTAAAVREEVLMRCEIFAPHGGFVFNPIHNIQPNTPTENIVAMIDALREFNGRSRGGTLTEQHKPGERQGSFR